MPFLYKFYLRGQSPERGNTELRAKILSKGVKQGKKGRAQCVSIKCGGKVF